MVQLPAQHPRPVGCHFQSISYPICLSSFLAQTYMAMPWLCPWEGLLAVCGLACPGPGMLHLQATMHFEGRNQYKKWGLGTDLSLLDGLAWGLGGGRPRSVLGIFRSAASQ